MLEVEDRELIRTKGFRIVGLSECGACLCWCECDVLVGRGVSRGEWVLLVYVAYEFACAGVCNVRDDISELFIEGVGDRNGSVLCLFVFNVVVCGGEGDRLVGWRACRFAGEGFEKRPECRGVGVSVQVGHFVCPCLPPRVVYVLVDACV